MASTFNVDKYKQIFEQRYGKGAYEQGVSNARQTGTLKAQAQFEKEMYLRQLKQFEDYQQAAMEQADQASGLAQEYEQFKKEKEQAQTAPTPLDDYMNSQMPQMGWLGPYKDQTENAKAYKQKMIDPYQGALKDALTPKGPLDARNPNWLIRSQFIGG
ncbi:hypothetical protein LRR81_08655 [Metabacillus sp. GX 13764]|uniref:hypothetical protein n=1 Tax=Metabacillus kandeliae TaxID=2900151 RepID=UPI001E384FAA|nr:hypothetical protein [Metabacillus kandeliae]MCD7034303.1 hypothetical protein [Metabacillus kandeliae]